MLNVPLLGMFRNPRVYVHVIQYDDPNCGQAVERRAPKATLDEILSIDMLLGDEEEAAESALALLPRRPPVTHLPPHSVPLLPFPPAALPLTQPSPWPRQNGEAGRGGEAGDWAILTVPTPSPTREPNHSFYRLYRSPSLQEAGGGRRKERGMLGRPTLRVMQLACFYLVPLPAAERERKSGRLRVWALVLALLAGLLFLSLNISVIQMVPRQ